MKSINKRDRQTDNMLNKFIYWKLEKGCLVFAVVSVIYSIACFIGGLILIEDIKIAREYSLHIFLADAPENVIRTVYVVIAFLDVLSSVLLLIGIVKVRYNFKITNKITNKQKTTKL